VQPSGRTAKNSTLEDLSLHDVLPSDDDGAVRHAMHFHFFAPTLVFDSILAPTKRKSYAVAFD
jgi:hypothetical protein